MIHGLVATVEGRISPHAHGIVDPYLISATRMETSDEQGSRLACGLLSDFANSLSGHMVPELPEVMKALFEVIEGEQFDFSLKLLAINAVGDLCLATENAF